MIQGGTNPYKDNRRHPYEPTPIKPTYGNVNNASRLEPDDFTTSYTSYGLGTSVLNFNETLNSKLQNYVQTGVLKTQIYEYHFRNPYSITWIWTNCKT